MGTGSVDVKLHKRSAGLFSLPTHGLFRDTMRVMGEGPWHVANIIMQKDLMSQALTLISLKQRVSQKETRRA